jgi:hypothetical protein
MVSTETYVVSNTIAPRDLAPWQDTTRIVRGPDLYPQIAALQARPGRPIPIQLIAPLIPPKSYSTEEHGSGNSACRHSRARTLMLAHFLRGTGFTCTVPVLRLSHGRGRAEAGARSARSGSVHGSSGALVSGIAPCGGGNHGCDAQVAGRCGRVGRLGRGLCGGRRGPFVHSPGPARRPGAACAGFPGPGRGGHRRNAHELARAGPPLPALHRGGRQAGPRHDPAAPGGQDAARARATVDAAGGRGALLGAAAPGYGASTPRSGNDHDHRHQRQRTAARYPR